MRWFGFRAGVWGAVVWWLAVWKRGSGQRPTYTMYLPCFESSFPPQHPRRWHHNPRLPRLSTAIDSKYLSGPADTKADFPAVKIILSTTTFNSLQGGTKLSHTPPSNLVPRQRLPPTAPSWKATTAVSAILLPSPAQPRRGLQYSSIPIAPRTNAPRLKISQDPTTLQWPSSGKMAVAPSCHVGTRCRTSHRASSERDGRCGWYAAVVPRMGVGLWS